MRATKRLVLAPGAIQVGGLFRQALKMSAQRHHNLTPLIQEIGAVVLFGGQDLIKVKAIAPLSTRNDNRSLHVGFFRQ
ncbi:MAG TPA: hypothetical protein VG900_05915 [Hyphomicrobiaceae bacterium]|nr:hypothetical protein [Hyphomicrobiaceae bacterium]